MPIVSLDSDFQVYADIDMADTYLDAAFHADSWRLASTTDDVKGRVLVTATRLFDRQIWPGTQTDVITPQPLQWPRINTGIVGVTANVRPLAIVYGSIEMALAILDGDTSQSQASNSERNKSIRAGSVSITNFRFPLSQGTRFPQIVQELIGPYLGSAGAVFGARSFGTDRCATFPVEDRFTRGI